MALKILRKTVKRFFKYTNSIKSYDQKTVPMQCPGGTEKHGIGTEKRFIHKSYIIQMSCTLSKLCTKLLPMY